MLNKFRNKVVSIELKNKTELQGIMLDYGNEWICIKNIPLDYILDGYALIHRKYILNVEMNDSDLFKEKILKIKKTSFKYDINLNLNQSEALISYLLEQKDYIRIELKNSDISYVGRITQAREKSMRVHLFSHRAKWLKEETFIYNEIRVLYYDEDYVKSLKLLLA